MVYQPARRYRVVAESGAVVTRQNDPSSPRVALLPKGAIVVCAEVASRAEGPPRLRIASPAGWVSAEALEDAPLHTPLALAWGDFEARHLEVAPGDEYGLEFPFTHAMFQEMGAAFLTAAFHAAGSIGPTNRVRALRDYRIFDGGGASINAAFDVEYEIDEPELHTALFVKMPAADLMRKFVSSYMFFGETQLAMRFARISMPVPVTQYYYGDYSRRTSNGILVTARIPYGEPPIEPLREKGLDQNLPDAADHYRVLTRHLAKIVAFHKRGELGVDAERVFPFRTKGAGMPEVKVDPLIEFIGEVVPHLFPAEMSRTDFLDELRVDGARILENLPSLTGFLAKDVDYTGFCHANLNLDNAWFWRDEDGELQAGLIDWGSASQMSIGQAFQGMLFAADPFGMLALRRELVGLFVDEYHCESGMRLDPEALLLRAKLASMTSLPMLIYALEQTLENYSRETLRAIPDWRDPRVSKDSGLGTGLSMLGNVLVEWFDGDAAPRKILDRVLVGAE